ncbi:HHLA1 protein, partial [Machaerirhynchus nigripectus]|nr:HHLA1 protein [Machaerirhynchus nigripectus]
IMQGFCWHVAVKMSLGFLCLLLVFSTDIYYYIFLLVIEGQAQQGKLFLSLFLHFSASCIKKENKKEKQVAVLATAELPAKSLDLSAINLTELVNGMLSSALRGTKKLFSLLSVTSYSSFAFHKVSVTIYNISNAKNIDPGKFPMHYCYCLNNVTNDLTDFTALLVDIIGNSTSYLTEIFKSTSILSVRQSNDSDCIYICVMAGQTGKNLSDFLERLEKSPVINYTFSSNISSELGKYILGNKRKQRQHFVKLQEDPNRTLDSSAEHVWTFKWAPAHWGAGALSLSLLLLQLPGSLLPRKGRKSPPRSSHCGRRQLQPKDRGFHHPKWMLQGPRAWLDPLWPLGGAWPRPHSPAPVSMARSTGACHSLLLWGLCLIYSNSSQQTDKGYIEMTGSVCLSVLIGDMSMFWIQTLSPQEASKLMQTEPGCPQAMLREPRVTSPPVTLIVQKISPCVMELCRFFQLCLCVGQRRYSRKEAMRYCVEYYSWFVKNASYVCERVKRIAYSHTLKQKCLKNICTSV